MNKNQIEKNKTILKNKIKEKYKGDEEQFYKEMGTTSRTFWKRYETKKCYLSQVFKTRNLLEMTNEEMLFIFFGETTISRKVISFYNLMLKYIQPLSNEERKEFLNLFQNRINSLKEEKWWMIMKKKEKTIQKNTMMN